MSTTPAATLTVRLALHAICCARCSGIVPVEQAEQIRGGHWCCRSWDDCRARRATHRRITDALRAEGPPSGYDAGKVAA